MRSRAFAVTLLTVIGLVALAYSHEHHPRQGDVRTTPSGAQRAQKPNIILLEADDQSVSQFRRRIMPHTFREVVDSGTTFSQMVATPPLCCPSRAATLTGEYPHNSGVTDNGRRAYPKLEDKENVVPEWLQDAGYRTGFVGKFINGYVNVGGTRPGPGWNHWLMFTKPRSYWGPTLIDGRRGVRDYGPDRYLTRILNQDAARFVRNHAGGGSPFFLWYAPWAPHKGEAEGPDKRAPVCAGDGRPLPLPSEYARLRAAPVPDRSSPSFNEADLSDKPAPFGDLPTLSDERIERTAARWRCGAATLATFDRGIGRLVRILRRAGELDNTMIIYTSDNGTSFGQHRIPRGKIRPSDEANRVPTVVRPAGTQITPRKSTSEQPVGMIDVAPTILDAAGAKPCSGGRCRSIDGTSMWPLLSDPEARSWDEERALLLELDHSTCSYTAIRTTSYLYVRYREPIRRAKPPLACPGDGGTELYDRDADPFELTNLASERGGLRSVVADGLTGALLRRRLQKLESCSGHPGMHAPKPCE